MSIVESLPTYGVHYYAVKVCATKKGYLLNYTDFGEVGGEGKITVLLSEYNALLLKSCFISCGRINLFQQCSECLVNTAPKRKMLFFKIKLTKSFGCAREVRLEIFRTHTVASSGENSEPAPKEQARHFAGKVSASLLVVVPGDWVFPSLQMNEQLTRVSHDLQTATTFI